MSDLFIRLQDYGVDLNATLPRFVDDRELYTACLDSFFASTEFAELDRAMAAKDYAAAFEYAHSLKGVTGNMGFTPLYQKLCLLVEPLRHGETTGVAALYADVLAEYARLKAMLNQN